VDRIGLANLNIGICNYKAGHYIDSKRTLEDALAVLQKSDQPLNLTRTQIALGNVHRLTRNFAEARRCLTQAYSGASELPAPREECLALEFLGDLYRDEGKPEEARRYYRRAMAIAESIAPQGDLVLELLRREGECRILEGNAAEGLEVLAKALAHAKTLGDRFEEGVILRCIAQGMLAVGDLEPARRYARDSSGVLESIDARHEHVIARMTEAEVLLQISEHRGTENPRDILDQAWETMLVAQELARNLEVEYWTRAVQRLQSRITRRRAEEIQYASEREKRRRTRTPRAADAVVADAEEAYALDDLIIAASREMREVMQAVEVFAQHVEPVLLTGETGTGKEVVARRLHALSDRKDRPFVAVNVTAIPHSMFEREFFGHVKGAFSGAGEDQAGLAAAADGGTLFLDEIGDLSHEAQSKLLRLLQDGSYHALGDPRGRRADLRIIAATNANLEAAVASGRFREDLFYRLAFLTIPIPPLRDRIQDLRPLLDHFLSLAAGRRVAADRYFNDLSLRLLAKHGWPGNVRELAVVARRAHISMQTRGRVEIEVGTGEDAMVVTSHHKAAAAASGAVAAEAPALNRARILLALEESGGNRSEAARRLGVARATLYRRLARLGLD